MAISRSSFYAPPADKPDDTKIVVEMKAIADEFEAYGYRRMSAELRQRGLVVNAKKVRRLMRENDLNPRHRRRYVATTDSDHDHPIFPNRAKKLVSDGPNQLWVAAAMFRLSRGGPQNSNSRVSVLVSEGNCSPDR
jgi:putative transposase